MNGGNHWTRKIVPDGVNLNGLVHSYPMKAAGYTTSQLVGYMRIQGKKMTFGSGPVNLNGYGRKMESTHFYSETIHPIGYIYWA